MKCLCFLVDVHMYSLYVCVCLDFLMSLADFFVKGLPQAPETVAPSQPSDDQKGKPSTLCYSSHLFYK